MSFQAPISIADSIRQINDKRLLLPAIQREFVWKANKVEWLFDSLMQGYPFGSFLFWEVNDSETKRQYRYYEFLRVYRERYHTHNPEFNTVGHIDFNAVLDGQQRLTALYIGLTGTYAYKLPRTWWKDDDDVLPNRKLYLNISGPPTAIEEEETGKCYEFCFLTPNEYQEEPAKWFRVGDILDVADFYQFQKMLTANHHQESEFAINALAKLHAAVHTEKLINYYLVRKADMERALNVFVRVNSGGEPLSLSDMLMSTAIANWRTKDARKEIAGLVDQIRAQGFFITKDLILKACLYLYSSDIRYKVSNFSAEQVERFENNWDDIKRTILAVFDLVRGFGFNEKTLTSKNALLPIVYWVHHRGLQAGIASQVGFDGERKTIRHWLHVVLMKSIFGTSADTILAAIRKAFLSTDFGNPYIRPELTHFPADSIGKLLQEQGKDPGITEEYIDSLLYTQYEDHQAFSILSLLDPNLDYKNGNFHADHLHPSSIFEESELRAAGVPESELPFYLDSNNWNSILNLRHLDSNENKSKQDTPLATWAANEAIRQETTLKKFCVDHDFPTVDGGLVLLKFRDFVETRRKLLRQRLTEALQER